ncbi:hypothetical protein GYMLUDRAFT_85532 [Collybiopsis luxurians FD-317 M1]|uniref:DUF6533 domain-containing protein n=1 Tax=Collybiopsis luxurians FD-317 M1 TaxID=944289 RepID=A0A0D0BX30_9AGAR|nr:hypothetical protein GYMLUDRAFT_85532 [Collybiopsis luxurians FD-317 M1]
MSAEVDASIVALGYDLLAEKRYWVGITALWTYEYFLTLMDEVQYIWSGSKNLVFWLYFLNRYLTFIIIVVTCVAYFSPYWTEPVCFRYGYVEQIETLIMSTIAEALVLLRVYAMSGRKSVVLFCAFPIILCQWALLIYQASQSSNGTDNLALLLSRRDLALPTLPSADAYHLCISIPGQTVLPFGVGYLSLLIVFDGLAVLAITFMVMRQSESLQLMPILKLIQRDGLLYFAVLFSSNFVWLILSLYARPGLRFMQNQPAMVISSIMVNRITINLKKASQKKVTVSWGIVRSVNEDERRIRHPDGRNPSTHIELNEINESDVGVAS